MFNASCDHGCLSTTFSASVLPYDSGWDRFKPTQRACGRRCMMPPPVVSRWLTTLTFRPVASMADRRYCNCDGGDPSMAPRPCQNQKIKSPKIQRAKGFKAPKPQVL